MKKNLLLAIGLLLFSQAAFSQGVGYNPFNNSFQNLASNAPLGGSTTATFDVFFDFYKAGVTDAAGQGAGVVAVIKLRTQSTSRDATFSNATVVYQTITATYSNDSGGNDRYKATLPAGLPNGRYSWECEATHGGVTYKSWDYVTKTGNSLQYFTVGSAGIFRSMVIMDFGSGNTYYDLLKFQPGNTDLPALLAGPNAGGFCSSSMFKIGAEDNTYKNDWFGASNVTGNRMFYRLTAISAAGAAPACLNMPGAWNNFTLPFRDDCPYSSGTTPTYINTFAGLGGSCQIDNGAKVDQRWDRRGGATANAMVDVLPAAAAACVVNSSTGAITYRIELYTETDITVGGTNYVMRNPLAASTYYSTTFTVNGLATTSSNGFPGGIGCSFSPLPIELVDFSARPSQNTIAVDWKSLSEKNSSYFTVERSADGKNWREIGSVTAQGKSEKVQNYALTDPNPYVGINYYRLRIVDLDGNFQYSAVATARMDKGSSLHLYPNPVSAQLTVELGVGEAATNATFGIYNVQGVLVQQWEQTLEAGNNRVEKDLTNLATGVYFLRATDAQGNSIQEARFVKK